MPTVHTRYVTWISRGVRGHGSAANDIVTPLTTAVPVPGTYQAWAPPTISWTDGDQAHTATFAFWSETGAADGATATTNPSLSVNVGDDDVYAIAWYIQGGGVGNGTGFFVDSFDVDLGTFVDDDFVTVPGDPALTTSVNATGWVPTATAEALVATSPIHGGVPFVYWLHLEDESQLATVNLQLDAGTSGIDFAFYQSPARPNVRIPHEAEGTWVSYGVMVDGGGPTGNGPVPPWQPDVLRLAAGLMLAEASGKVDQQLRGAVLELAAKQVELASQSITGAMAKSVG